VEVFKYVINPVSRSLSCLAAWWTRYGQGNYLPS